MRKRSRGPAIEMDVVLPVASVELPPEDPAAMERARNVCCRAEIGLSHGWTVQE